MVPFYSVRVVAFYSIIYTSVLGYLTSPPCHMSWAVVLRLKSPTHFSEKTLFISKIPKTRHIFHIFKKNLYNIIVLLIIKLG